jgi:uncharacterized protein YlxW (UPF0749 family)
MRKLLVISFFFSGIILGLFLIAQFFTPKNIVSSSPLHEVEAKDSLIKEFVEEQAYLLTRVRDMRKKVEEKQIEIANETEAYNIKFLEDLRVSSGLKSASGEGVEINLSENRTRRTNDSIDNQSIILASDLRDIVNVLFSGQAEAVSINNHRIFYGTVISSVGNTVLINNIHSSAPYTIKAIGEKNSLISSLQNKKLMGEFYRRVEENNFKFYVEISDDVFILPYNGTFKVDYINLVE